MIRLLLALALATPFVADEEAPAPEVVEEVEQTEETTETEITDIDEAITIIEELQAQIEKYKSYVENETVQTLITALLGFLATLGALLIKFKSFDKSTLTLDNSKKLLEQAQDEVKNVTKELAKLGEDVAKGNNTTEELIKTFTQAINTINKSLLRLGDRVEALEKVDTPVEEVEAKEE